MLIYTHMFSQHVLIYSYLLILSTFYYHFINILSTIIVIIIAVNKLAKGAAVGHEHDALHFAQLLG